MSAKTGNSHGLTDLEYNFCWAYAKSLHLTNAVIDAGYHYKNKNNAANYGHNLLKKPKIRAYLNEILDLSTVTVLNEVVKIAMATITDVVTVERDGSITAKPSEDWSDRARAAVKSIKTKTRTRYYEDGSSEVTVETEVTMYDRLAALDKLMRKLGMFPTDGDIMTLLEALSRQGLLVPGQAEAIRDGVDGITTKLRSLPTLTAAATGE